MTFEPIFFETAADAERAAVQLAALPGRVRNLLAESVEHQELFRTRISAAAITLADAGFLRIRDVGQQWAPRFVLTPTLSGEEALACLEQMQADEEF